MPKYPQAVPLTTLLVFLLGAAAPQTRPATEKTEKQDKPRFVTRGQYVEDTKTGLLWQRDGDESGKKNFQQAAEYAKKLRLGGLSGWRVPTREELAGIFPATEKPFKDTKYTEQDCCGGPHEKDTYSYWTGEWDGPPERDYAYVYQWYGDGGPNNCFASKNFAYVRCVRDPVAKKK